MRVVIPFKLYIRITLLSLSSSLMMNEGPLLDEAALYQEALRDQIRTHHEDLLKLQGTVPMPIRVASAQHCSLPPLH